MKRFVRENSLSLFFLTIFLLALIGRQRGSPESKPVGAPTEDATGEEG